MGTSPQVGMDISGDKWLIKTLQELPDKVFRAVIKTTAKAVMKPLIKEIRFGIVAARRAQGRGAKRGSNDLGTGLLSKSIGIKQIQYRRNGTIVVLVGARSGFVYPGRKGPKGQPLTAQHVLSWLEHGTVPHYNSKKRGSIHLGQIPRPIVRQVFERNKNAILTQMNNRLMLTTIIEAEKLAAKNPAKGATNT